MSEAVVDAAIYRGPLRKLLLAFSLAYVGSVPLGEIALGPGRSLTSALGIGLLVTCAFWLIAEHRSDRSEAPVVADIPRRVLWASLICYTIWLLLSTSWTQYLDAASVRVSTDIAMILLVPALAVGLAGATKWAIEVFVGTTTFVAVFVLVDADGQSQATAAGLNQNGASLYLTVACGWALRESIRSTGRRRIAFAAAVCLLGVGSLATGSRTGLIALVAALAAAVLASSVGRLTLKGLGTGLSAIVALVVLAWSVSDLLPGRLWGTAEDAEAGNLSGRSELWQAIWFDREAWLPWGVGPGGSIDFASVAYSAPKVAHNTFLTFAVELGIVGIGLLLFMITSTMLSARLSPFRPYLAIGAVPTLIFMTTLSLEYDKLVWVLVAMSATRALPVESSESTPRSAGAQHDAQDVSVLQKPGAPGIRARPALDPRTSWLLHVGGEPPLRG